MRKSEWQAGRSQLECLQCWSSGRRKSTARCAFCVKRRQERRLCGFARLSLIVTRASTCKYLPFCTAPIRAGDFSRRAIALPCVCNRWSIRAADLYVGAGSSDLDKDIVQRQETQATLTSCSLLARHQQHLVLVGVRLLGRISQWAGAVNTQRLRPLFTDVCFRRRGLEHQDPGGRREEERRRSLSDPLYCWSQSMTRDYHLKSSAQITATLAGGYPYPQYPTCPIPL